jgi:hypothetical protein
MFWYAVTIPVGVLRLSFVANALVDSFYRIKILKILLIVLPNEYWDGT